MKNKAQISPEKKEEYYRTKQEKEKKKRLERKREMEEGTTAQRRMAFLVDIFKSLGYTQDSFARAAGVSSQLMSWYLSVTDDCQLSRIREMLERIGVDISVKLEPRSQLAVPLLVSGGAGADIRYRIEGTLPIMAAPAPVPEYIQECGPGNRLYFLRKLIETQHLSAPALARSCGIDPGSLRYYFLRDDIKTSIIYRIAEAVNADVVWTVNPIQG